jgi:hypothetical protein
MPRIRRTVGLTGLTGLLALAAALALAIPVKATPAGPLKGDCVFAAKALANVNLIGGKGTFALATYDFACAYIDPKTGQPTTGSGSVSASGTFKNIVCGTGKVVGTITGTAGDPKFTRLIGQKFAVELAGGQGQFYWHDWLKSVSLNEKGDITGQTGKIVQTSKNWQLAGEVDLTVPTDKLQLPPPPPLCTKAFTVAGTVAVDH